MQEAPFSVNFVMFDEDGLRHQFTVRSPTREAHKAELSAYKEELKRDGWRVSEKPRMPESWADVPEAPPAHGEFVRGGPSLPKPDHRKPGTVEEKQLNTIHALGTSLYGSQAVWDEKRPNYAKWASKNRTSSSKELWVAEATTLIGRLEGHVREEYTKLAEGWSNPFELADIDVKYGVELAHAMTGLRAVMAKAAKESAIPA